MGERFSLEGCGIEGPEIFRNLSPAQLYEPAIAREGSAITSSGALATRSGAKTGLNSGKILASAKKAPSKAEPRTFSGAKKIRGYRGVARSKGRSVGGAEGLRGQAAKAANSLNREGAAQSLVEAARNSVVSEGGNSGGRGSFGADGAAKGRKAGGYGNSWTVGESLDGVDSPD